jgi:hypothetical protein
MNWRLTIALPLLLAAAPAHASHWEMTCPNVRADLPPDTISSDPERGYLLVSGALRWLRSSKQFPRFDKCHSTGFEGCGNFMRRPRRVAG